MSTPALPAGYTMDVPAAPPPLPAGYSLDSAAPAAADQSKKFMPGRSFGMDVARGMGLDADKISDAELQGGQGEAWKELGRQVYEGLSDLAGRVVKDPFTVTAIPESMASALENGVKRRSPGQVVGALSSILGGAEGAEKSAAVPADARAAVGTAIHTAEGDLTPGASAISKATGGAVGAVGGHLVGGPIGSAAGAAAGYTLGPSLMERIFPESQNTIQVRNSYLQAKTITEAQEAAIKENALIDARAQRAKLLAERQQIREGQAVPITESPYYAQWQAAQAAEQAARKAIPLKDSPYYAQNIAKAKAATDAAKQALDDDLEARKPVPVSQSPYYAENKAKMDAQAAEEEAARKAVPISQSPYANRQLPAPNPFPGATSSIVPIGHEPLPIVPQGKPTPFGTPTSALAVRVSTPADLAKSDDLISRTQRLVQPNEMPDPADLKRAGDLTQAPLARLQLLAKFGDRLAQNEINRRLKNP